MNERDIYQLRVFGSVRGAICSSSGVRLMTDAVIGNNLSEKIDTLIVAGASNLTEAALDARVIDWLRYVIPSVRRYGSICSGAFLLARAGLLNGRRVTAHRAVADRLAQAFPSVTVDLDAIYVRDGRLGTATGVTAGLDLNSARILPKGVSDIQVSPLVSILHGLFRPLMAEFDVFRSLRTHHFADYRLSTEASSAGPENIAPSFGTPRSGSSSPTSHASSSKPARSRWSL
jgi:putative intracellular protease/amidase